MWVVLSAGAMLFLAVMMLMIVPPGRAGVHPSVVLFYLLLLASLFNLGYLGHQGTSLRIPGSALLWVVGAALASFVGNFSYIAAINVAPNPGYACAIESMKAPVVMLVGPVTVEAVLRFPVRFTSRFMGPIMLELLSAGPSEPKVTGSSSVGGRCSTHITRSVATDPLQPPRIQWYNHRRVRILASSAFVLVSCPPMSKRKKPYLPEVLLLIETSTGYGRGILEGIGRYVRERGPWLIYFERRGLADPPPRWLRQWRGHGIIARTATPAVARRLRGTGLPVVELLGDRREGPAKVHTDNTSGGRLAGEHLLDCGLRNFGFFASEESWAIPLQRKGFCEALAKRGYACSIYETPGKGRIVPAWQESQRPAVTTWLQKLPKPAGVFTCDPEHALCLLDICRTQGIAVPEQVAIIASGDDPVLYNVTTPPLSGVDTNPGLVGYEAAALLDRMMAGQRPPKQMLSVPPARIVARQSTDVVKIADTDVAAAVRFIRQRACLGIDVSDVAATMSLARRTLERRFREHLGRTPKGEILRVRLDRAKMLLQCGDASIESVARRSGFASFRNFARIFRREVGMTPRQFRRERKT